MRIARFSLIVTCCLLSAISCKWVLSERPVPAEEDSVVDPRLIGMWKPVKFHSRDNTKSAEADSGRLQRVPFIMVITRSQKSQTTMDHHSFLIPQPVREGEESENPDSEKLLHYQGKLYIHRDKISTISLELLSEDNPKTQKGFSIDRYELEDENTLLLYALDFDHLEKAVKTKQLKGTFGRSKKYVVIESAQHGGEVKEKDVQGNIVSVVLADDPKKIIRYLEEHPEAFEKNPSVYKRINYDFVNEKNEEAEFPETVAPINPSGENVSPPEKIEAIAPAGWQEWFTTFFSGLAAGVVVAIIAMIVLRKYNSRITT